MSTKKPAQPKTVPPTNAELKARVKALFAQFFVDEVTRRIKVREQKRTSIEETIPPDAEETDDGHPVVGWPHGEKDRISAMIVRMLGIKPVGAVLKDTYRPGPNLPVLRVYLPGDGSHIQFPLSDKRLAWLRGAMADQKQRKQRAKELCEEISFLHGQTSTASISKFVSYATLRLPISDPTDAKLSESQVKHLIEAYLLSIRPAVCQL